MCAKKRPTSHTPPKTGFHRKKKIQRGQFVVHDDYFFRAKKLGYRARSVFKLLEIQERFSLISPDMSVLDIGSAPGSFLQAIDKIIAGKNLVIGVDLKPIEMIAPHIHTIVCDVFDFENLRREISQFAPNNHLFDVITSDIAPNTTGRFDIDQYASVELNTAICQLSDVFLKIWGNMILKVFQWEDFYELSREVKQRFADMKTYKPLACRDSSHEIYVLCFDKKW